MEEELLPRALTRQLYSEQEAMNHTRAEELQLREYIRTRDPRAVDYAMYRFDPAHGGIVHKDPRISQLYRGIGSITILTRYCIDAGMPEQKAYTISDFLLQQLDPDFSEKEISEWYRKALTVFLSLMPQSAPSANSPAIFPRIVTKTMDYCLNHPAEPLLLQHTAKVLFVNPDYLSKVFREATGITYSRFVRHLKAETAREMLRYTSLSAAEIAVALSFSSQSYFIRIFREEYGMTPREYRRTLISADSISEQLENSD